MTLLVRYLIFFFGSLHYTGPVVVAFLIIGLSFHFFLIMLAWVVIGLIYVANEMNLVYFENDRKAEKVLILFVVLCGIINMMWIFKFDILTYDKDFINHLKIFFEVSEVILGYIIIELLRKIRFRKKRRSKNP